MWPSLGRKSEFMCKVCLYSLACDNQNSSSWLQQSHKHQCKDRPWHCRAILCYKEKQMIQNMLILFLLDFHQNKKHNTEIPSQKTSHSLLLSHKKEWDSTTRSNMAGDYHTKWIKQEGERQIPYITYMRNLKYDTNEPIYDIQNHGHRKQTYGYRSRKGREGIN